MIDVFKLSERAACKLSGVSRTGFRYCQKEKAADAVRLRLKVLASQYPRYGYLMLHGLLKGEGLVVNRKHTYRLYTEGALQVRTELSKTGMFVYMSFVDIVLIISVKSELIPHES